MEIFTSDWIGLVVTGLGTLFLLGEILVNMRGIFALLGIGFMIVYFSTVIDTSSVILMLIIYFLGLLLIIIDGKLTNDGTLAIIGLACMLLSVAINAPNIYAGLYAVIGVIVGGGASFLFLKVFKHRKMWSKMTLKDRLTSEAGYNSMNHRYQELLNMQGITISDLRPVGTVKIDHQNYSAISNGEWIAKDTPIMVEHVDGTKILVTKCVKEDELNIDGES